MEISYIILVHKNPEQLRRLVAKLDQTNVFFYVHVDKKAELTPFEISLSEFKNVIFITKREDGRWGDIGIVKATIHALEKVVNDGRKGYCVLLSGQDYPIKTNEEIRIFLKNNEGANFVDTWAIPSDNWYNRGLDRIECYKCNYRDGKRNYVLIPPVFSRQFYQNKRKYLKQTMRLLLQGQFPLQLLKARSFPKYLQPFGGSQWWAVTTDTAKQLIYFLKNNRHYLQYHRYTLLPDEIFFQSIIMHVSIKKNIPLNPSLTYVRWESRESAHPVCFSSEHNDELTSCRKMPGKMFARKFENNDVLNFVDTLLNVRPQKTYEANNF